MTQFFKIKFSQTLSILNNYKLPMISGVLQATSYIPFPPWALFFCLVPLWFFWIKSDFKKSIVGTLVCAFIASFIGFYWIAITVHDFGEMPWVIAILALSGFSLIANIYLVFASITWRFFDLYINKEISLWLLPLITAVFMCFFPSLFPFHFGYAWIYAKLPGAQVSDIFGVMSLALVTLIINFLIFMAIKQKQYLKYGLSAMAVFVTINSLGLIRLKFLPTENESIKVMIVQANIGNLDKQISKNKYSFREVILDKYLSLSEKTMARSTSSKLDKNVDLVVWPETAYPSYLNLGTFDSSPNRLNEFAKKNNVAFATGFYQTVGDQQVANAILYVDQLGKLSDFPTQKTILLAFGEYLPFAETFPYIRKLLPMVADFKRGPGPEARSIANIRIGPLVCYESLFPDFSRDLANLKINLFINLTNDSWYDDFFEPYQHMYITAGRALENRRPIIRATNTGISTVIKSNGEVMELSPRNQEWTGLYDVFYPDKYYQSPYQKWGRTAHHFILIGFTLMLLLTGFILRRTKKQS